ncbi:hypothetical protein [Geoglobus acetivorans]|uniref:Hydrogenase maturation protease n=1 Tax=Geoglobus acetivorans TaxID=565033 RepID=A0A0A7GD56_GEOAI|nr:hypothetical protein GACE_0712 [Geoglobus acetivorans]
MTTVVIGVGNPYDEIDSTGLKIAEKLARVLKLECRLCFSPGLELADLMRECSVAIIVDSTCELDFGEVRLYEPRTPGLKKLIHSLDVLETLHITQFLLDEPPQKVIVIGIGVKDLKSAVGKIDELVMKIVELLETGGLHEG